MCKYNTFYVRHCKKHYSSPSCLLNLKTIFLSFVMNFTIKFRIQGPLRSESNNIKHYTNVFIKQFPILQVFHLRDIRWERPQFLSKSFLGFVTFNIIIYSLLAAEVVTTQFADTTTERKVRVLFIQVDHKHLCYNSYSELLKHYLLAGS